MALRGRLDLCEEHEPPMNLASTNTTGSASRAPSSESRTCAPFSVSKPFSWWPAGCPSPRSLGSPPPSPTPFMTGSGFTSGPTSPAASVTRPAPDGRVLPAASPTPASSANSAATRCAWATTPPAGRWPCWPSTWAASTTAPSRPAPSAAGCTTWTFAGSDRATSTPTRTRTGPRKKGAYPPPEADAAPRCPAVRRCDHPALVPALAVRLGLPGRADRGQDYRAQCQAGLVRGDQPAYGAPAGLPPVPAAPRGLPGLPALPAAALPRAAALAAVGQGPLPRRRPQPATGGPPGDRLVVAAQAVPRTQRHGSTVQGPQAVDRGEPPV